MNRKDHFQNNKKLAWHIQLLFDEIKGILHENLFTDV